LDSTAKQQELFREGGFTGVGVTDNGERPPFADLFCVFHKGLQK
jgi:hypothetical protein